MKKGFSSLEIQFRKANLRPSKGGPFLTGFTLIEIVISMAILAVGLVGILSLFPVGFDSAKRSMNLTQASLYAQGKLAEIKRDGFPEVDTKEGAFIDPNYKWELVVTDETPAGYLRKVELTVKWNHKNKIHREVFTTYAAKHAP